MQWETGVKSSLLGRYLDRLKEVRSGDPVESLLRLESELRLASAGYYRCRDYGGVSGKLARGCIIIFFYTTSHRSISYIRV